MTTKPDRLAQNRPSTAVLLAQTDPRNPPSPSTSDFADLVGQAMERGAPPTTSSSPARESNAVGAKRKEPRLDHLNTTRALVERYRAPVPKPAQPEGMLAKVLPSCGTRQVCADPATASSASNDKLRRNARPSSKAPQDLPSVTIDDRTASSSKSEVLVSSSIPPMAEVSAGEAAQGNDLAAMVAAAASGSTELGLPDASVRQQGVSGLAESGVLPLALQPVSSSLDAQVPKPGTSPINLQHGSTETEEVALAVPQPTPSGENFKLNESQIPDTPTALEIGERRAEDVEWTQVTDGESLATTEDFTPSPLEMPSVVANANGAGISGMQGAEFHAAMKNAVKTDILTGQQGQFLPRHASSSPEMAVEVSSPAQETPVNQTATETLGSVNFPASLEWTLPVDDEAGPTSETVKGNGVETPATCLTHAQELILEKSVRLKHLGVHALGVSLKPDGQTELFLKLTMRDGFVEATAKLKAGDVAPLQAHWGKLQAALAESGVRMAPLELEPGLFGGNDFGPFYSRAHDHSAQQEEAFPDRSPHSLRSITNSPPLPEPEPALAAAAPGSWQSWA